MKILIFLVLFFLVGSVLAYSLSNFAHPLYEPSEHVRELKKITTVDEFYQIYGNDVKSPYSTDKGLDKYRIVFTAQTQDTASMLEVYYFAWMPSSVIFKCISFDSNQTWMGTNVKNTYKNCIK